MKNQTLFLLLAACLALAACGSKGSGSGVGPGGARPNAQSSRSAAAGDATAEEVAREARGEVSCPARSTLAARAEGAPVDDVLGVRPGLSYEEAVNIVLCSDEMMVISESSRGFDIKTYGQKIRQGFTARFAEARVAKSSREIMKEMQDDMMMRSSNAVRPDDMKPGQSKWYVTTMGLPGKERVIAVAREEWFASGKNPPVESVVEALVGKYGPPTGRTGNDTVVILTWAHDPSGRPVNETSPLRGRCNASADPDGGTNFSPDCGLVVAAQVRNLRDNPALAQFFQVGMIDQARGYEAITATEQALQGMDSLRQAQEVRDAAKNTDAPRL